MNSESIRKKNNMIEQYTFFYQNYGIDREKTHKKTDVSAKNKLGRETKLGKKGTKKQIINLSGMFPGH